MTSITYHPTLAAGRWYTLTLAEQLGNVGSEYERAVRAKASDHQLRFEHAFERMLELLDLTIRDERWKNHRLKELTRLREMLCDELWNEKQEYVHPNDLREYFLCFGILARKQRDGVAKDNLGK
jgi:hypothetical protein